MNLESFKAAGSGRKTPRTVFMDDVTHGKLWRVARYTGRSMSDIVRALVDELGDVPPEQLTTEDDSPVVKPEEFRID